MFYTMCFVYIKNKNKILLYGNSSINDELIVHTTPNRIQFVFNLVFNQLRTYARTHAHTHTHTHTHTHNQCILKTSVINVTSVLTLVLSNFKSLGKHCFDHQLCTLTYKFDCFQQQTCSCERHFVSSRLSFVLSNYQRCQPIMQL